MHVWQSLPSRLPAVLALLTLGLPGAFALPPQRSVSSSRQFLIYCDDAPVRLQVSSAAEETKAGVLALMGEQDQWKMPIIVQILRADPTAPSELPARVRIFQTEVGFRLQVDVRVGAEPAEVELQRHLVHALLLEFAYREQRQIGSYVEPPPWLVAGIVQHMRQRERGPDASVYRTLLETQKLPPLRDFLGETPPVTGTASRDLYRAYAVSLVQLLTELPDGKSCLRAFLRGLPSANETNWTAELMKHFPALTDEGQSLEKWWSLSLARLAASDRHEALSLADSEDKLQALLVVPLANKAGQRASFSIDQFAEFTRLPQSAPALTLRHSELLLLGTRVAPLYRPIVKEYAEIFALLSRGKTHGIEARLRSVTEIRQGVMARMDQIADYLNWFEATQVTGRSDSFDGYFKAAQSPVVAKRQDAISVYLDRLAGDLR